LASVPADISGAPLSNEACLGSRRNSWFAPPVSSEPAAPKPAEAQLGSPTLRPRPQWLAVAGSSGADNATTTAAAGKDYIYIYYYYNYHHQHHPLQLQTGKEKG